SARPSVCVTRDEAPACPRRSAARGAPLRCRNVSSGTRVSLERDRDAAGSIVLAERETVPIVGHEDPREIGMTVERDAVEIERLALGEVGAHVDAGERRKPRVGRRYLTDDADAPVAAVRQEVHDDLEALQLHTRRTVTGAGE